MPGMGGTVSVQLGQKVAQGDSLVSIEAMKMETAIRAEQGGVIKEVLVKPGQSVNANDLLLVYA